MKKRCSDMASTTSIYFSSYHVTWLDWASAFIMLVRDKEQYEPTCWIIMAVQMAASFMLSGYVGDSERFYCCPGKGIQQREAILRAV
jgi:hypothetical protein